VPVAHACNPSYSGGRDQDGRSLSQPYLEKVLHKKWLVEWLEVQTLSSNPSTTKTTKNKKLPLNEERFQLILISTCML
jgi:hypothetical protein